MLDLKEKVLQTIDISKLRFTFSSPPLLVSGMAMMYHSLRESTKDIDFILSTKDHKNLSKKLLPKATILNDDHDSEYQDNPLFTDLWGDHGILIYEFELWDNIMLYGYDDLKENAIQEKDFIVISLEKLMLLSMVRGEDDSRYIDDAKLIAKELKVRRYKGQRFKKNEYWKN